MLLFNKERKIFLGNRLGEPDVWQLPQGGAEGHLTLEENVIKELSEETGAESHTFEIVKRCQATHRYEFEPVPRRYRDRWRGQEQSFWIVKFLGTDEEITLGSDPEFSDWRWCTTDEIRQLAEPKRLIGYEEPLREFEDLWQSEKLRDSNPD